LLSRRQGNARCYSSHELCLRRDATPGHDYRGNLTAEKTRDDVIHQAVDAQTRVLSLRGQIDQAARAVDAAAETLKLSEERKEFAVGNVLEVIQAEQDLTRARTDYANAVVDYNKAQYALTRAIGGLK
jgi:Outer membrane protein